MDNVRTVLPPENIQPTLHMNVLRVIEEHLPIRLKEIEAEVSKLNTQLATLGTERHTLLKIQEAVKKN